MSEYRGDQYLYQGMSNLGDQLKAGMEQRKKNSQLATSLRKTLSLLDPENSDGFNQMSLGELQGYHEGLTLQAALSKASGDSSRRNAATMAFRHLLNPVEGGVGPTQPQQGLRQAFNSVDDIPPEVIPHMLNLSEALERGGGGGPVQFSDVPGMEAKYYTDPATGQVKVVQPRPVDLGLMGLLQQQGPADLYGRLQSKAREIEHLQQRIATEGEGGKQFSPDWNPFATSYGDKLKAAQDEYNRLRLQLKASGFNGYMPTPLGTAQPNQEDGSTRGGDGSDLFEEFDAWKGKR